MGRSLLAVLRLELEKIKGEQWPNPKWQKDPVGFVRNVLGETPLPHQEAILAAMVPDGAKVAVRSGQKIGKTKLVVWLALWFYCSFPESQVHMTATNKEQVERVLWQELGKTRRIALGNGFEIEEPAVNPSTGLRSADESRVVRGFTVRDVEAMSGLSGEMLFIVDEASSLPQNIAEGIEGNTIGLARMIWISNPTRTAGPFFDAFHSKKEFWRTFHISSEDVAKWCASKNIVVRGVANIDTIERWEAEWGRDSPFFLVRVLGKFLVDETGKIFSLGALEDGQARWRDRKHSGTLGSGGGRLSIGVDPAGPGGGGDETAFAVARGQDMLLLHSLAGNSEDANIVQIRTYVAEYRVGDEIPDVIVDCEGPIGHSLWVRLKAIAENLKKHQPGKSFNVYGVKASAKATRESQMYDRRRDELWASGRKWLLAGGSILPDAQLERELHFPDWVGMVRGDSRLLKVTDKDEFRKALGRSPDKADAFLLSVWEPQPWAREEEETGDAEAVTGRKDAETVGAEIPGAAGDEDPYAACDPYGYR